MVPDDQDIAFIVYDTLGDALHSLHRLPIRLRQTTPYGPSHRFVRPCGGSSRIGTGSWTTGRREREAVDKGSRVR
jgi:hypothetical protein